MRALRACRGRPEAPGARGDRPRAYAVGGANFRYPVHVRTDSGDSAVAAWLPVLKAVLPYVTSIVTATVPAFTQRKDDGRSAALVGQQISELQEAVRHNAESVKLLAEQLQRTIQAIEAGAVANERALRRTTAAAIVALVAAGVALAIALAAMFAR